MNQASLSLFLQQEFFNNTVQEYSVAFGVFFGLILFFYILSNYAIARLKTFSQRTETHIDDQMVLMVQRMPKILHWALALYGALFFLELPEQMQRVVRVVLIILLFYWVTRILSILVEIALQLLRPQSVIIAPEKKQAYFALKLIAQITLWSVALLTILSNLGVNITALMASLGVGGIAVALAAQSVLGDMISSVSIYLDRPFEVGDFIIVGDIMGTVKKVGLKTTRIQALQGEEIVISNQELVNVRIHNYRKMQRRRILFGFGVTYNTSHKKLADIPKIIKKISESIKFVELDRVHFKSFGQSSLDFEVVYFINTSDYIQYMDVQQEINLAIVHKFEKEGIQMAFPTRTVYLANK